MGRTPSGVDARRDRADGSSPGGARRSRWGPRHATKAAAVAEAAGAAEVDEAEWRKVQAHLDARLLPRAWLAERVGLNELRGARLSRVSCNAKNLQVG